MIQPIASGRLFERYKASASADFGTQEQDAIARLEKTRAALLQTQNKIQQMKSDAVRFGESQGDPNAYAETLAVQKKEYDVARAELSKLRAEKRQSEKQAEDRKKPNSLTSFIARQALSKANPDELQKQKTFQYYDNRGAMTNFAVSALQFLGSVVDVRV